MSELLADVVLARLSVAGRYLAFAPEPLTVLNVDSAVAVIITLMKQLQDVELARQQACEKFRRRGLSDLESAHIFNNAVTVLRDAQLLTP